MLFDFNNETVSEVKELAFKSEKELQVLCEKNLLQFINLDFIETEFVVADFRLDTVAFDKESNAFIIIEYKNHKNISVIDQGYTYLATMLNHKADFVLKYNIRFNLNKNINDFDWSQSKVIFISPNFNKYQINSINFKDLPIELWKIKQYQNKTILLEQIVSAVSNESIKDIAPVLDIDVNYNVSKETKIYSENELTKNISDNILDIYYDLKEYILGLDDSISLKPTKLYISFNRGRKSIISIKLQKKSLVLWINTMPNMLNDPSGLIKDVTNIGHHGNGNSQININDTQNIGYIKDLLKVYIYSLLQY